MHGGPQMSMEPYPVMGEAAGRSRQASISAVPPIFSYLPSIQGKIRGSYKILRNILFYANNNCF